MSVLPQISHPHICTVNSIIPLERSKQIIINSNYVCIDPCVHYLLSFPIVLKKILHYSGFFTTRQSPLNFKRYPACPSSASESFFDIELANEERQKEK